MSNWLLFACKKGFIGMCQQKAYGGDPKSGTLRMQLFIQCYICNGEHLGTGINVDFVAVSDKQFKLVGESVCAWVDWWTIVYVAATGLDEFEETEFGGRVICK